MRLLFVFLAILIVSGLYDYHHSAKLSLEMVAFNSLTKEESNRILVSPKDSHVNKVVVDHQLNSYLGGNHLNQILYEVTFNHTETDVVGNLIVYIAEDEMTVIGKKNHAIE
ncbi:hypothetical protein [Sutcliffiella rhizosphaerae]|uniref:Uncharacterized protein n=1 Tax=Sutcliffiella rhizosphaerae TaxID=2880967 RepID=A0ABM8YR96_9BACI|nr:hypothetical protein [Sutcliffiella rhizosphaerae]CAG9622476.1 hypothetical protein BACCIP111883_03267 [Sutcliffiella rhizosphaerae]